MSHNRFFWFTCVWIYMCCVFFLVNIFVWINVSLWQMFTKCEFCFLSFFPTCFSSLKLALHTFPQILRLRHKHCFKKEASSCRLPSYHSFHKAQHFLKVTHSWFESVELFESPTVESVQSASLQTWIAPSLVWLSLLLMISILLTGVQAQIKNNTFTPAFPLRLLYFKLS